MYVIAINLNSFNQSQVFGLTTGTLALKNELEIICLRRQHKQLSRTIGVLGRNL